MRIMVAHEVKLDAFAKPVETYSRSMVRTLRKMGHEVIETPKHPLRSDAGYRDIELLLDIDCGRDAEGNLRWHGEKGKPPCPSAVYFIDSHGYPAVHKRLAKNYDHIFFAVWDRRDLFADHKSAHWCPNFTDLKWFDGMDYDADYDYDFGFFGSKGGLDRAQPLVRSANDHGWSVRVAQIASSSKQRWPHTAEAMAKCKILFNHGQKHDGPNLRVMESMAMLRPLICDRDKRSGLDKLFVPYQHYVPYEAYTYNGLDYAMSTAIGNPKEMQAMATRAYHEVCAKHLVENRLNQILEVVQ